MISLKLLRTIAWVLAVGLFTPNLIAQTKGKKCGIERWAVKTLSDAGGKRINVKQFQDTSIAWLISQQRPSNVQPASSRISGLEYKVFRIKGIVIGYRLESDGDFYVVIADPNDRSKVMAAEIPDPECDGARNSGHAGEYSSARAALIHMLGPFKKSLVRPNWEPYVTITGVAFFDRILGQTGLAKNGIELHPVVSIQ